ncbi:hypothetical protein ZYGR_0AD03350 [Zygosaccharomyces rouxii]|uniref:Rrn9 domain-containing protein n=1 Tax=Zygosaccharomyces rouxii TaxID=4956 RepID=A0A1Q3A621_ZYGRO|nr:hypothetical protein ZYGR_0AD03350 [Zygosaccharomyces rouxii]
MNLLGLVVCSVCWVNFARSIKKSWLDAHHQGNSPIEMSSSEEEPFEGSARIGTADKSVIDGANELLESLEQSHRADLALHLYSSYLLKNLLYRANEKKHPYEVDQFIKTQIKDNWTNWPSSKTVIDPQTDKLYEDAIISNSTYEPGEISPNALTHSASMLRQELDSYWQGCLAQCASASEDTLDVDKMEMPSELAHNVIGKLDRFFEGLHHKVAKKNKIELQQDSTSKQLTVSQPENETIKGKRRVQLRYHDIISRGCEMGEDMTEIYMKSLELYNDIPGTIKKNQFKLPKTELKKYRPIKGGKSKIEVMRKTRENYLELEKLLKDKRLTAKDKMELKKMTRKKIELSLSKKNFFQVKGYGLDDDNDEESDPTSSNYNVDDALIRIPRRK